MIEIFKLIVVPVILYLCHWCLVYKSPIKGKISWLNPISFRYFWNIILLLFFLPVAVTGVLLYFGITGEWYFFWHNKLGVIFVVIASIHLITRFNFFLNPIKNLKKT